MITMLHENTLKMICTNIYDYISCSLKRTCSMIMLNLLNTLWAYILNKTRIYPHQLPPEGVSGRFRHKQYNFTIEFTTLTFIKMCFW